MSMEAINVIHCWFPGILQFECFLPGCFRDCENMQKARTVDLFRTAENNEANIRQDRQISAAK